MPKHTVPKPESTMSLFFAPVCCFVFGAVLGAVYFLGDEFPGALILSVMLLTMSVSALPSSCEVELILREKRCKSGGE